MMKLYSMDDCPWCVLLKKRLDYADVKYEEVKDSAIIEAKGFKTVPQLEITTGNILDFNKAIIWINEMVQADLGVQ